MDGVGSDDEAGLHPEDDDDDEDEEEEDDDDAEEVGIVQHTGGKRKYFHCG